MATSGSYDFTETRLEITKAAMENCGILSPNESPTSDQITSVSRDLNLLVKGLQANGIRIWKLDWRTATFTASSEVTGTDSNIYTCTRSHTSGATSKPITGANYTTYWRQDGSTGGTWVTSTAYSAVGQITPTADVIGIYEAFLRRNNQDIPLEIIAFDKYFSEVFTKYDEGQPQMITFDSRISPQIYLYPQPNDTTDVLHYLAVVKLEDFDADANDADFPAKLYDLLVWGLSYRVSHKFRLPLTERQMFLNEFNKALVEMRRNDKFISSGEFLESCF